ncbi:MAG: hypothetical protein B6I28_04020 [Fusobacteriia bacterium 4572_132]|nr:MAG: hypothetical protein B6I28_04020 [Fusobacteriia bacterium 4572_132]
MKKIFLMLFILFNITILANSVNITGSLDLPKNVKWKREIQNGDNTLKQEEEIFTLINFSVHGRYDLDLNSRVAIGVGLGYEGELRDNDNYESIGFSTIPLYFSGKYDFLKKGNNNIYISGRVGISGIFINKKRVEKDYDKFESGFYYSYGMGIESGSFLAEISYSVSKSELEANDEDVIIKDMYEYPKISITFGKKIRL